MSQIRTPPSLKWLLDKRARLLGEIIKLEGSHPIRVEEAKKQVVEAKISLDQAKQHLAFVESGGPSVIESLRRDLQSIDNALALHEIQINPKVIPPIRTPDAERTLPFGAITRTIFECLKFAGGGPLSTLEITEFVAANTGTVITNDNYQIFRKKITWRLKGLCAKGKIKRLHQVKGAVVGRWILSDDPALMESALHPKYGRPAAKPTSRRNCWQRSTTCQPLICST